MKKIVFVITPFIDRKTYTYTPPFSVMQIIAKMKNKSECEIVNFAEMTYRNSFSLIGDDFYEQCAALVYNYAPGVVVFVSTVYKTMSSTLLIAKELKCLNANIKVILGGHHSSLHCRYILEKFQYIDYITVGFSAMDSAYILDKYIENNKIPIVPSLSYRNGGEIVEGYYSVSKEKNLVLNLTSEYEIREEKNKFFLVENGFGCSRNCIRCNRCFTRGYQKSYDVDEVLKEILVYRDEKEYIFYIYDLFIWDDENIRKFCKALMKNNIQFIWHTRGMIECINEEMINLLYDSNCRHISIGIKKNLFGVVNNNFSGFQKMRELAAITNRLNISVRVYFDIGEENETEEQFEFKLQFLFDLSKYNNIDFFVEEYGFFQYRNIDSVQISQHLLENIEFPKEGEVLQADVDIILNHPELFSNLYTFKNRQGLQIYIIKYAHSIFRIFHETISVYLKKGNSISELIYELYIKNNIPEKEKVLFLEVIIPYFDEMIGECEIYQYERLVYCLREEILLKQNGLDYFKHNLYIYSSNYNISKKTVTKNSLYYYILKKKSKRILIYKISKDIYLSMYENIYNNVVLSEELSAQLEKIIN